jgi:hypothetical protein
MVVRRNRNGYRFITIRVLFATSLVFLILFSLIIPLSYASSSFSSRFPIISLVVYAAVATDDDDDVNDSEEEEAYDYKSEKPEYILEKYIDFKVKCQLAISKIEHYDEDYVCEQADRLAAQYKTIISILPKSVLLTP